MEKLLEARQKLEDRIGAMPGFVFCGVTKVKDKAVLHAAFSCPQREGVPETIDGFEIKYDWKQAPKTVKWIQNERPK